MVSSDFTYMRDLKNKTNSERNKHKGVKPINMEHKLMVAEGMGWAWAQGLRACGRARLLLTGGTPHRDKGQSSGVCGDGW